MKKRLNQPDTPADVQLRQCLNSRKSFVMTSGAGSGKTTSLVKALAHLGATNGVDFRREGRQVACITYTEIAAAEIWSDVGDNPLFHVSTIHSFLWAIIKPFQKDIKEWVRSRIDEKIVDSEAKIANGRTRPHTRERERANLVRYGRQLERLSRVTEFRYGTGSDYRKGILGHDDIIKMVPHYLSAKPLLASLVAKRYPFIFIDESQDTLSVIVTSLKNVWTAHRNGLCLGFFGDPMQKIFPTGIGSIPIEPEWEPITKRENFRCPRNVRDVINAIRREDDGLQQIDGRPHWPSDGSARMFIGGTGNDRTATMRQVLARLARENADDGWLKENAEDGAKILVVAHRMAAHRLGFPMLFAAFNDDSPPAGLKAAFNDGSSWPLAIFLNCLLPLAYAIEESESFKVIALLREHAPALSAASLAGKNVSEVLDALKTATERIAFLLGKDAQGTVADVLTYALQSHVITLEERWQDYRTLFNAEGGNTIEDQAAPWDPHEPVEADEDEDGEDEAVSEESVIQAFLRSPAKELRAYGKYATDQSVFATQQGVKGAEFDRVLTILDDEEGTHPSFSYDRYFEQAELTPTDQGNLDAGRDSVIGRTRRVFYVSCSRATRDLAVLFFTPNKEAARDHIVGRQIFSEGNVVILE